MPRLTSAGPWTRLAVGVAVLAVALSSSLPAGSARAANDVLHYLGGEVKTLDPAFIGDAGDVQLLLQLYAGLTRLDENGEAYPSLAASWTTTDGGKTYTFTLRSGLRFSDGSPLTAADVRRSWLRILDPATRATAPDVLSVIAGAEERLAGGPETAVGVEAPNPTTVVVHLRHPAGYFPAITATPATFVVPPQADASPDWQQVEDFVGSGPYVAKSLDDSKLVMTANPDYVAGPPPITEVDWLVKVDSDGVAAYADQTADLVGVSSFAASWMAYDPEFGPALHQGASLAVQYIGFDTSRPPFDDPKVRLAFAAVLDRRRLVPLSEGNGGAPASSIVPPALWPAGLPDNHNLNAETARRLLDEAGYADRDDLGTITVGDEGLGVGPAVAIWREELGAHITVESRDFADYLQALQAKPTQIFTVNWIADYPSPYALYSLLLLPNAADNYGRWEDQAFVNLLQKASSASGEDAQAAAYADVDAYVDDQVPVLPWSYPVSWWLVRPGLRGLGNLTTGLLDFGRVSWDG
ncbi:MAG TPA: peptide ABC transporter substrate-binding protein [Candidatus Limnocylindria bacterium]